MFEIIYSAFPPFDGCNEAFKNVGVVEVSAVEGVKVLGAHSTQVDDLPIIDPFILIPVPLLLTRFIELIEPKFVNFQLVRARNLNGRELDVPFTTRVVLRTRGFNKLYIGHHHLWAQ